MLLPTACPLCQARGPAPCHACRAALRPPPALPAPKGLASFRAVMAYEGAGRELVLRLKYRNARSACPWLASQLVARAPGEGCDLITWVPTTARRRRRRGFDQSELLARALARALRLPCRRLLVRAPGASQTGLSRPERLAGPRFELRRRAGVPGSVLLVDDVVTTGGTMSAAALCLGGAGASKVHGLALARRGRAGPPLAGSRPVRTLDHDLRAGRSVEGEAVAGDTIQGEATLGC